MAGPDAGPVRGPRSAGPELGSARRGQHRVPADDRFGLIDRFAWLGLLPWGCSRPMALTLGVTWLLLGRLVR